MRKILKYGYRFQALSCTLVSLLHRPLFIKFSLLTMQSSEWGQFSFLMVRWLDMLFRYLELYWSQKGAIEVDYTLVKK